mgnify:CR=1 FL=1
MSKQSKIQATKIRVRQAEGPHHMCDGWNEYDNFTEANARIARARPPREDSQGNTVKWVNKVDFEIIFADDTTYRGRYEVKSDEAFPSIQKHVMDFVQFCAGTRRPAWMSDKQYNRAMQRIDSEKYQAWIEQYALATSEQ